MRALDEYRDEFNSFLASRVQVREPKSLYEPIHYLISLGGKRLRPLLTMMVTELFEGESKNALEASLAIELFHNFSLVHDDIMDRAPMRRGNFTVHEKWDVNTAILSGDAILISAFQLFEKYPPPMFKALLGLFSATALRVCEGQQFDMDFEIRGDVTIREYLHMISNKTAVLIGAAMKMGAMIAAAPESQQDEIYEFGRHLGLAFQLQDDYLDTFGDANFGKQPGGDIIANKKTFLYLKALEKASRADQLQLATLYATKPADTDNKVRTVREIYIRSGAAESTVKETEKHTAKAFGILDGMQVPERAKSLLREFGRDLMQRKV